MNNKPIIRPATAADLPAACEIVRLAWQPVFAEFRRRLGDEIYQRLYLIAPH